VKNLPPNVGPSGVTSRHAKSILTRSSGFVDAYDYTLNPYSGCTFACTYCYAAFFAPTEHAQEKWGHWVQVKANALDLLRKKRKRPLTGRTIYMSSVTDPYQPIERKLRLTRSLLEELVTYHQPKLVLQTRATLVTRDIDLLTRFKHVQVNMTVTTDTDDVRRAFEPMCPSTEQRLAAIQSVHQAGVQTAIAMTPLLPLADPAAFAKRLMATGVPRFVLQDFHSGRVRFAAGTGEEARAIARRMGWDNDAYAAARDTLAALLPDVRFGKEGFVPRWDHE
jgi:DNA repair photolyase